MKKHRILALAVIVVALLILSFFFWHGRVVAPPPKHGASNSSSAQNNANGHGFNKQKYSTADPASIWVVVNKQHPLSPINYAPTDLVAVGAGQYMRAEAAGALTTMLADAKVAGYSVTSASGYRSYTTQVAVYGNEVKSFGQAVADSESARPGYSEHQTGWAIDLASGGCSITDCFGNTPGGKWVTANAYKYGFLLRYTTENTKITGYRAEAWHFRYIGTELSQELHKERVTTLEQFFGINGGSEYK